MVKQIIYPKYAMWVFIYTSLFALFSILYGKFLDYLAIEYDRAFLKDGDKKSKVRLVFEICLCIFGCREPSKLVDLVEISRLPWLKLDFDATNVKNMLVLRGGGGGGADPFPQYT